MHKSLNHIPIDPDFTYNEIKSDTIDYMERALELYTEDTDTKPCTMVVESYFYHMADGNEEDYGMDWLIDVMAACLFCIKHNGLYPKLTNRMREFIIDIDSGEYDYLFAEEDIDEFKEDYNFIKGYINSHS